MKTKVAYIETQKETYPLVFNLNVMEEIQELYGSVKRWVEIIENKGGETKVKDLKKGLLAMVNEAIDIENEENKTDRPFVTDKQLGRIMSECGIKGVTEKIKAVTVASSSTGVSEKNA